MTIAVGVLCKGGAVLAADTEESDGWMKIGHSKIRIAVGQDHACGIAGAGDAGYVDALTDDLSPACFDNIGQDNRTFQAAVSRPLQEFHRDHIIPFASYPPGDRPSVSFLIGATKKGEAARLFVTDRGVVRRGKRQEAVGVGAMYAKDLMQRLGPRTTTDFRTAIILAAYVLFQVKHSIAGCGFFTEIVVLHDGKRMHVPRIVIHEIETIFMVNRSLEGKALGYALTNDAKKLQELTESFAAFRRDLDKLDVRLVGGDHTFTITIGRHDVGTPERLKEDE